MSSRESGLGASGSGENGHLADVLPLDRTVIESHSWAFGTRITASEETTLLLEATHRRTRSSIAVFEATEHTDIVQFRTPVGREKFYGVAATALRPMLRQLLDQGEWRIQQGRLEAV